jgi:outer membrane protein
MRTVGLLVMLASAVAPVRAYAAPTRAAAGAAAVEDLVRVEASGLTAERVGARAAATSFTVKAYEASLRAAAARVDRAWVQFLPRLEATGRYTRLSDFTPPTVLGAPPGTSLVVSTQPAGAPFDATRAAARPFPTVAFPVIADNYLLQATIVVPISDYFLRIVPAFDAATQAESGARFELAAARAKSAADGKIAYFTWLRARGAATVAELAAADQKAHLRDAMTLFGAGSASRADVLAAQTRVAASELQVEQTKDLVALGEKQVRLALHAKDGDRLVPGEGIDGPLPPATGNLRALTLEALTNRPELKGLDAYADAVRQEAKIARAALLPRISAFGDAVYGNPNPRMLPPSATWLPTWDAGAQISWSPNDALAGSAAGAENDARASALEAQRGAARDGVEVDVLQAFQSVGQSDLALESTKRELALAEETYRVARQLYGTGRSTSLALTDAETELTRARLDALNARVDARVARVRLDHAVGRDARVAVAEVEP